MKFYAITVLFVLLQLTLLGSSLTYSFSGTFPTRVKKEGNHGDQRRLDYVFISRNLATMVKKANTIVNDTTLILSDHLPVVLELSSGN